MSLKDAISDNDLEFAILACVRYSLGRRTYSTAICRDLVVAAIRHGSDNLCKVLEESIEEHSRKRPIIGNEDYGDECDQREWSRCLDDLIERRLKHDPGFKAPK